LNELPSGKYDVSLIVGDAFIQNSFVLDLVTVELITAKPPAQPPSELKFFTHEFRKAETRPKEFISTLFTGLVLSPILILLIGVCILVSFHFISS
jgi:hypothetical protein